MSPKHGLVIDDNIKNVNVLVRLLAEQGVTSAHLIFPKQLETVLESMDKVDVVFVDLEMPGIDGFDVLERLKSDARFQGVPIVAYTVHVSEMNAAYQRGFDGFIGKPLDPDRFPGQLARIFRGEPVWESA
jgi:two-component system cell cycle response regulator DivK